MVIKTFVFNFQKWINNEIRNTDQYQDFLNDLYQYDEGSHSLFMMETYYKGVYDCLFQYEPLLHSELTEFKEDFQYRLPLECKDHAFNYFLKASLSSDPKDFTEIGRVHTINITFEIEEEPNND